MRKNKKYQEKNEVVQLFDLLFFLAHFVCTGPIPRDIQEEKIKEKIIIILFTLNSKGEMIQNKLSCFLLQRIQI